MSAGLTSQTAPLRRLGIKELLPCQQPDESQARRYTGFGAPRRTQSLPGFISDVEGRCSLSERRASASSRVSNPRSALSRYSVQIGTSERRAARMEPEAEGTCLPTADSSGWRQLRSFRPLPCDKLVGASTDPDPLHLDAGPNFGQDDCTFCPTLSIARPRLQPRETGQQAN
jgi:hypothetical protein